LQRLGEVIRADFSKDLTAGKKITASEERGKNFTAKNALDGHPETYWATGDNTHAASVEIDFGEMTTFNRLLLQEHIRLGQRVTAFRVFIFKNEKWEPLAAGTTVGYKRILRFENQTADRVKIEFEAGAPLCISRIGVFEAAPLPAE
jgi:alpha-L-fucosidase